MEIRSAVFAIVIVLLSLTNGGYCGGWLGKVTKNVKDELARFDDNVLQPIKESVSDELARFDDDKLQPIKEEFFEKVAEKVIERTEKPPPEAPYWPPPPQEMVKKSQTMTSITIGITPSDPNCGNQYRIRYKAEEESDYTTRDFPNTDTEAVIDTLRAGTFYTFEAIQWCRGRLTSSWPGTILTAATEPSCVADVSNKTQTTQSITLTTIHRDQHFDGILVRFKNAKETARFVDKNFDKDQELLLDGLKPGTYYTMEIYRKFRGLLSTPDIHMFCTEPDSPMKVVTTAQSEFDFILDVTSGRGDHGGVHVLYWVKGDAGRKWLKTFHKLDTVLISGLSDNTSYVVEVSLLLDGLQGRPLEQITIKTKEIVPSVYEPFPMIRGKGFVVSVLLVGVVIMMITFRPLQSLHTHRGGAPQAVDTGVVKNDTISRQRNQKRDGTMPNKHGERRTRPRLQLRKRQPSFWSSTKSSDGDSDSTYRGLNFVGHKATVVSNGSQGMKLPQTQPNTVNGSTFPPTEEIYNRNSRTYPKTTAVSPGAEISQQDHFNINHSRPSLDGVETNGDDSNMEPKVLEETEITAPATSNASRQFLSSDPRPALVGRDSNDENPWGAISLEAPLLDAPGLDSSLQTD